MAPTPAQIAQQQNRHPNGQYAEQRRNETHLDSDTWPSIGSDTQWWEPEPDLHQSRRQRAANRGQFSYAVTPKIAHLHPRVDPNLILDADEALEAMRTFDRESAGWGIPFASVLLRSESSSSSQIENLTASARRVALAAIGGETRGSNAELVARNTAAMNAAIDLADNISANSIRIMHERLQGGDDPANAGRFRKEPVWIGGQSPVTATFVAVHHDEVDEAVDDLVAFCRRTDLHPIVQASIAHAQFETIHPFTDGNGRTGRALVSSLLRYRGVTSHMSVPISSGLLVNPQEYFDGLSMYRSGDVEPIIEQFVVASKRATDNAALLRQDILEVRNQVLATAQRKTANVHAIADLCCSEPAFIASTVAKLMPVPTAYRLIEQLEKAQLIRKEKPIWGVATWTVPGLTDALDRFAERAGRRGYNG